MGEPQEPSLAEIKEAIEASRQLLLDADTGTSVREFVERWDRAWAARVNLLEAFDQAEHMLRLREEAGKWPLSDTGIESMGKLMEFTRDFFTTMTADKAPTPEQRTRASLERIEERLTAIEETIERL